jgi:hypothetical protein
MLTSQQLEEVARRNQWLADVPLFTDRKQIERFYDAVIRPPYLEGPTVALTSRTDEATETGKLAGELTVGAGGGLLSWLGLGKAEVKGSGEAGSSDKTAMGESRQVLWIPVQNPERQLIQLVFNYELDAPTRLLKLDMPNVGRMFDPAVVQTYPRALVILDLPGHAQAKNNSAMSPTRLIPMAAELDSGEIVLLYRDLRKTQIEKVAHEYGAGGVNYLESKLTAMRAGKAPGQPALPVAASEGAQREQEYWEKFLSEFDSWAAMRVVEEAVGGHRIRWIDFRLPLSFEGRHETCHLHLCPAGEYDTGVFAYNFVQRGFEFGLRIVGTLKDGFALNVLAVYEK